jgi:hypothetical protein
MTLPKAVSDVSCSACEELRPASDGKLAQACSSNDRTTPVNSEPEGKNVDRDFIGCAPHKLRLDGTMPDRGAYRALHRWFGGTLRSCLRACRRDRKEVFVHVSPKMRPSDLEPVFKTIAATRAQALDVVGDPYLWGARSQVAALALSARLPTSFVFAEHVEAGGLMSYGADTQDWMRQAAVFVDKIFKGAKPGDLPVEQPSKIDLVINRKTASVLGLEIPQALLLQAARVIE